MSQGIILSSLCRRLALQAPKSTLGSLCQGLNTSFKTANNFYESSRSFHSSKATSGIMDLDAVKSALYPDLYDRTEQVNCSKFKSYDLVIETYLKDGKEGYTGDFDPSSPLERFTSKFRISATLYRCLGNHYNSELLRLQAVDTYVAVSEAYASGDLEPVRKFMSANAFEKMRGEVLGRQRALGGPRSRVDFAFVDPPTLNDVEQVLGAIAINPTRQGKLHFAQWTIRIKSKQVMAAYDALGRLVAGDPNKVLEVEDYWVFERPFFKGFFPRRGPTGAEWKLVAQLKPADMIRRCRAPEIVTEEK